MRRPSIRRRLARWTLLVAFVAAFGGLADDVVTRSSASDDAARLPTFARACIDACSGTFEIVVGHLTLM